MGITWDTEYSPNEALRAKLGRTDLYFIVTSNDTLLLRSVDHIAIEFSFNRQKVILTEKFIHLCYALMNMPSYKVMKPNQNQVREEFLPGNISVYRGGGAREFKVEKFQ